MTATLIDQFREIFSCVSYRGDQHTNILIQESDKLATLKKVTLTASNGNWIAITPDKGRGKKAEMSPLLATGAAHKHHCACDCVVFTLNQNVLTVIYIDLKSGKPNGYENQFKSTRQFVRYVIGLLEEFSEQKIKIDNERYVIFYGGEKRLLNKTPSVPKIQKVKSSSPNNAYKLQVDNDASVYLNKLLTQ